jgi:hypothetical protein
MEIRFACGSRNSSQRKDPDRIQIQAIVLMGCCGPQICGANATVALEFCYVLSTQWMNHIMFVCWAAVYRRTHLCYAR